MAVINQIAQLIGITVIVLAAMTATFFLVFVTIPYLFTECCWIGYCAFGDKAQKAEMKACAKAAALKEQRS